MRLARLLKRINRENVETGFADLEISSLACNSQEVQAGALFIAINGNRSRGSDFIGQAVKNGAVCVISDSEKPDSRYKGIPFISFPDTRYAVSVLADEFFGHPSGRLKVAGVTGTNGKTTITYLIKSILEQANLSCGIVGTINYSFQDKVIPAPNTTPGPLELQKLLKEMADAGCSYCAMEVSSHALDQKRTAAIDFAAAIFTNLTQDHLDYHLSLENYFLAKVKLFSALQPDAYALINLDSPLAFRLKGLSRGRFLTYGLREEADILASDLNLAIEGSEFNLKSKNNKTRIKTNLIGRHNISNILAGAAFAITQGIGLEDIKKAVENFPGVKGRLERIPEAADRNVFVDYAHTPDALENVLSILRQLSKNRLTVVFGCGGERDRLKRPLMAQAVERYADNIIITSDNPRSESPRDIARETARGIRNKDYKVILDRREAIGYALEKSGFEDTILIAGKGHENYQIFKDRQIEFDDSQVVRECLNS